MDNGNSLWFNSPAEPQVKVTDFTNHWFEKLSSDWIENTIQEELAKNKLISKERATKISTTVTILQRNLITYAHARKRKEDYQN